MKITTLSAIFLATMLPGAAQESSTLQTLQAALKYRAEMATAVGRNPETAGSALQRLRESGAASGLTLGREADLAYAALDVGHRLLGADRPEAAEVFFRAAEQAFAQAASETSPSQTREKARYLQKLALIRASYLNKIAEARADIDEAIRLQPEDESLKKARVQLARGRGEYFKEAGKN